MFNLRIAKLILDYYIIMFWPNCLIRKNWEKGKIANHIVLIYKIDDAIMKLRLCGWHVMKQFN